MTASPQGEQDMSKVNSVVAIYQTHSGAKEAVKELQRDGVDTARGSMVTHSEAGWVIATDKASRLNLFHCCPVNSETVDYK
jgi:hypothetical protein